MPSFVRLDERMLVMAIMKVKMKVPVAIVRVRMHVDSPTFSQAEKQQPCSQSNDHHRDAEFQCIGQRFGDGDSKNDDEESSDEKRCRVTQAPQRAHPGSPENGPPFADDGRDSGKVVRFGGVFQSQRKSQAESQQNRVQHRVKSIPDLSARYKTETEFEDGNAQDGCAVTSKSDAELFPIRLQRSSPDSS